MKPDGKAEVSIGDLLNAQTGKIGWPELARHFARGVVIAVSADEDLVMIAEALVSDRAEEVEELYKIGAAASGNGRGCHPLGEREHAVLGGGGGSVGAGAGAVIPQ